MNLLNDEQIGNRVTESNDEKGRLPRRKFTMLRLIANFFKLIGVLGLVILLFSILMLIASDNLWLLIGYIGLSALSCITSIAIGEAIFVFLNIEENTGIMRDHFLHKDD